MVNSLMIKGGTITAIGSQGAGIGSGHARNGSSVVGLITVGNASLVGQSSVNGAGVGHGSADSGGISRLQNLVFAGDSVVVARPSGDHFPVESLSLILSDGSIVCEVPAPPTVNANAVQTLSQDFGLVFLYENATLAGSEKVDAFEGAFLQIGDLNLPNASLWNIRVWNSLMQRRFRITSSSVRSFTVSVPSTGSYQIDASSDSQSGVLITERDSGSFDVHQRLSFVSYAHFALSVPRTPLKTTPPKSGGLRGGTIASIVILTLVFIGGVVASSAVVYRRVKYRGPFARDASVTSQGLTNELLYDADGSQAP
jgi:hypothetical protein